MNPEIEYLAMRHLLIPNGQGKIPSATRVAPGEKVIFDGDEPVNVPRLAAQGFIQEYTGSLWQEEFIQRQAAERKRQAIRPRMTSRRKQRNA